MDLGGEEERNLVRKLGSLVVSDRMYDHVHLDASLRRGASASNDVECRSFGVRATTGMAVEGYVMRIPHVS
jgi:hypothetical protein